MRKLLVHAAASASLVLAGGHPAMLALTSACFATTSLIATTEASFACESDLDCADPTPICDLVCVQCLLDSDCDATSPRCSAGSCVACSNDGDCARFASTPVCGASGACGECSAGNSSLCLGNTPVCDTASATCSGCSTNGDCSGNSSGGICLPGGACGDAVASCSDTPLASCAPAPSSSLRFGRDADPARNSLVWTWSNGDTPLEAFGDPVFTTHFALCLYRDDTLVASALLDPSANFWKSTRAGYKFAHPVGNLDSLRKVTLRWGSGDARIAVKGKGAGLDLPALPLGGSSVTLQLVGDVTSGPSCFDSRFAAPYAADRETVFKARASD